MIDETSKAITVRDIGKRRRRADAVLRTSMLAGYVDTRFGDAISDRRVAFDCAAEAFRKELASSLTVKPVDNDGEVSTRYEQIGPFIVKILLYIGKVPTDTSFVVAARLIEACVLRPAANIADIIKELAADVGSTFATVKRIAEGSFNCYDEEVLERISYLTGTKPLTALDAVCDLAIYIRRKMYNKVANA